MYSTKRGLYKVLSIGFVVLLGWFVLLSTGNGSIGGQATYASPALEGGPASSIYPSWVISPSAAVLTPNPIPAPIEYIIGTGSSTITYSQTPELPWDTEYIKVGSVIQDPASKTYRMYYESNKVIISNYPGNRDFYQIPRSSAIGVAFSSDGINWSRPVGQPIFTAQGGAWDSLYVGDPRVVFDGNIYRMFYVGSNTFNPQDGPNYHFNNDAPAYIGLAESLDGINWTRDGRTSPVLTTTVGAWDDWYVQPNGVRIENGTLKLYYTGGQRSDPVDYRTGLASLTNFANYRGTAVTLTKASGNPVVVNGNSNRIKGSFAARVNNQLLFWYVNNFSGSDLIYQAYGNSEVNFTRDPDNNILKPITGSPNDLVSQVDVGSVQIQGNSSFPLAKMWFTGRSATNLKYNAFRAVAPNRPLPPPQAFTPNPQPTRTGPTPTPTLSSGSFPAYPPPVANGGPSSFYTPTPGEGNYTPFYDLWRRVDEPVRLGFAQRSWTYDGSSYGFKYLREPYEGGSRLVTYHDKARMEEAPNNGVTNGLLVKEMISGLLQVGDNKFEPRLPAVEAVAGDAIELNPTSPAYYSFSNIASLNNDKRVADRSGQVVIETLNRAGNIGADGGTGGYGVTYGHYEPILGHNIASVFWNYFQQRGTVLVGNGYTNDQVFDWLSTVGLPLSEPYWAKATVAGQIKDVLVQPFERRILTYTPSNTDPFKVEMGNAGRHYYHWRYNLSY